MLETLVLTLKDGLELAILSGILLGFLRKLGQKGVNSAAYYGFALALPFSILLGYSLANLKLEKEIEIFFAFTGLIFTSLLIIWVWHQSSLQAVAEKKENSTNRIID